MITRAQIDAFYNAGPMAMVGVSRNPKKFGYVALKTLADKKKWTLYPVNPHAEEIYGMKCYHDISQLPEDCKSIVIMTNKNQTLEMLKAAIQKGIPNIWIQQGTHTPEALIAGKEADVNLVYGKCIIMFADPVDGFHKFHRNMLKFFGRLPK